MASNSSLKVFYPLPSQAEGKVFAAKQLFLSDGGGIWLQDVRNQVLFFDGQSIMPEVGSALDFEAEQVAFIDNAFWTFFQNEVYRTVPNQEKELIFSLTPGSEILRMGASKRFIWLSDERNFYTYNVDSKEFQTFSLMEVYQYNQSSKILINDAQFIFSRWVLATNAGVYLSKGNEFEHIPNSGKNYVEKLYFSDKRRELIIGTLNGSLIFDIVNPAEPIKTIAGSHVLSITETNQEYWIGTEKGLFVYSFLTGETKRFDQGFLAGNELAGEKIYSLLNDNAGGIWIATDRGVRYFSLFSHKFDRFPNAALSFTSRNETLLKLLQATNRDGYWALTDTGVYQINLSAHGRRTPIFNGKVHDIEDRDGVLWLATDDGIICIDGSSGEIIEDALPPFLKQTRVDFLEMIDRRVWGASREHLWSYDLDTKKLTQYGSEWMLEKYLPAQLTEMKVTKQGALVLGTEHGVYLLRDGQVLFVGESVPFGEVIDIAQPSKDEVWVAARYGLYELSLHQSQVKPLTMVNGHITPKCLLQNQDGIWLTSSAGLSRYDKSGEVIHHYGEPFGLINNEFSPGLCSYSSDNNRVLLLGTKSSLVKVNTHELVVSRLPEVQVIFSQVKRDQQLYSLGITFSTKPKLDYRESITFQFGVIPRADNLDLEYRLNDNSEWLQLDGTTLTIQHLMPGHYKLDVRALRGGKVQGQSESYSFSVTEPWFMTTSAIVAYIVIFILVVISAVYWRSRLMSAANRELKGQVALKTNQLRHQSRILLTNNQQLRKQLQVRRLIFLQSVSALKDKLKLLPIGEATPNSVVQHVTRELDLIANTRSTNGSALPVHNLTLTLQSALSGWKDELTKAGISVELDAEDELYIGLVNFNLDEIFSLLFDGVIKRCYRNQTVIIQLVHRDETVTFSMLDQGEGLDSASMLTSTVQNLRSLVEQSGGEMSIHVSDERNLLELTWQASDIFDEHSIVTVNNNSESPLLNDDDPWLEKVVKLVEENYADPDFSTSSAAKLLFVSERSLQRRLKSAIEKTFTEYLTEVRLDNACRRLLAGEKVSDVAFECGFNDPSYFSQRFKHRFGMSPTQFIEQQDK
ncbi:helix-turn-helix domain-containing protein [Vibrio aquaticus]|uniref:Helix-turn-helix domain-containing protein n=1 Tax=Vibrio aquaticus TaxID=2496559 RepID=A0A432CYD4_9VIBR|nr:helix-turn-helix domain-containing protein [Vibrio aquaticus]RTZ16915.1 helix-turn-helix domain-containing protein [Vibrio aquaticus]